MPPIQHETGPNSMNHRRIDGFFYGLFMDEQVLTKAGTAPENFRPAFVEGFSLKIGARATLVPSPGDRAYGMLISLTHADLDKLYNAPGLEVYRPEAVLAYLSGQEVVPALCYNLVKPPEPQERNPEYAARLRQVLANLGFPDTYIESVG